MSDVSCDAIAKLRRKLQRISNKKIIFLDETHIKLNEVPRTILVAPGEKPYVIVTDSSSYAFRYDLIAAVVSNQVFPPVIFTPQDQKTRNVKGINGEMLIDYIENVFCPAIDKLNYHPIYLIVDKSNIHNVSNIEQALRSGGCTTLTQVLIIPTQAGKRINPLDNTLFHEWKEKVRQHSVLTEDTIVTIMINEWNNIKEQNIKHHYDHCAISYGQNVYNGCPSPLKHHHSS